MQSYTEYSTKDNSSWKTMIFIMSESRHAKTHLEIFVIVIPKEGFADAGNPFFGRH